MIEVKVSRVKLDAQGYNKGGRYFGVGGRLYRAVLDDGLDLRFEYLRAASYQDARSCYKLPGYTVQR